MGVWLVPIVASLHLKEVRSPDADYAQPGSEEPEHLLFSFLDESDIPIEHRKGDGEHAAHAAHAAHDAHETHGAHGADAESVAHGGHDSVKERTQLEADGDSVHKLEQEHAHSDGHHSAHGEHAHEDGEGRTGEVIAKMLLGSVAFQMAIFYLVNNSDADIRRYAWTTVGTTMAIFSAVLIYGACHEILDALTEEAYYGSKVIVSTVHCVAWFFLTEIALLIISKWKNAWVDELGPGYVSPLKRSETSAILDMKCWGGFLGHVTAFASITVYMQVQRRLHHTIGGSGVFLIPVIAVILFVMLFFVTGRIREAVEALDGGETKSDEIWEEVAQEVENDVFSICLSFLLAECVFYLIEGSEYRVRHAYHSDAQISACWLGAAVFAIAMIATSYARVVAARTIHGKQRIGIGRRRLLEILQSLSAFGFAWCALAAVTWKCDHLREAYGWTHIWTEVTVAMIIALSSVAAIFIIDKIADMESVPQNIEDCMRESVTAFGFLIGFSWEHAFHKSIEDITAEFHSGFVTDEALGKALQCFVLCVGVVIIVFPAYRWYIVPTVYRLTEGKEAGGRAASAPPTDR
jgi:hypothetical protein